MRNDEGLVPVADRSELSGGQTTDYYEIATCTESYFDRFGDSPLGMGWPTVSGARDRYRVMLEVIQPNVARPVSLLDFGCGGGYLLEYLQLAGRTDIEYSGLDLSARFIELCRRKFPRQTYAVHPSARPREVFGTRPGDLGSSARIQ